jgi:hypothetical protein
MWCWSDEARVGVIVRVVLGVVLVEWALLMLLMLLMRN